MNYDSLEGLFIYVLKVFLLTICMYGSETLKLVAELACQTTLTLVRKNEPRLPCSEERFHTPED